MTTDTHTDDARLEKIMQFVKYCLVGVLNTLVTLGVIYLCKSFFGLNLYVSNALGYICGVINSFLCNKTWVFRSKGGYTREAVKFLIGFALCYALQFWVVWMLNESTFGSLLFSIAGIEISGYGIATLLGNVVYTLANFVYNRLITFK
ncbi:MAG: GtrA family protein [Muribaculaceae bacterium]|nr:GtrA family protein [Muribaculaceae bacterium]